MINKKELIMAKNDIKFYNVTKTLSLYSDQVLMYMVIGARGVGKSYSTKMLLANFAADNSKIFILDPENEYTNLA